MVLKKPSELFNKKESTPFQEVREEYSGKDITTIDEALQSFQVNVNHIQSLNDFTKTFGTFSENVERIQDISEEFEGLKKDINTLVKKEDLDDAMMAHLMYVKESIAKVEEGIDTLNTKSIYKIKNDFSSLAEKVDSFINVDALQYKKDLLRSENRVDIQVSKIKDYLVAENEKVDEKIDSIEEKVKGINLKSLSSIREKISSISEDVDRVINKEIPKYKTFFAETELKTEESISSFNEEFKNKIESFEDQINEKVDHLNKLIDDELPKYNNQIVENKLESEGKINRLRVNLEKVTEGFQKEFSKSTTEIDGKLGSLQELLDESRVTIDDLSSSYESLYKDFKNREISSDRKLQSYEDTITEFKEKVDTNIDTISNKLSEKVSDYSTKVSSTVRTFKEDVSSKVDDLEIDVVRNEEHIKTQNEEIGNLVKTNERHVKDQNERIRQIRESVSETIKRLKLDEIERKNKELTKKVLYIEKVLDEFNEKELLTENMSVAEGLLNIPPNVKNSDPLTPLDQKYVTLDQLSEHYRLFINRVQQQLATLGGGGETTLQYLDDISGIATDISAYDGMYLQVDLSQTGSDANKKFKFGEVTVGAAGTWRYDVSGISTSKNIGIGTTSAADTALLVVGDAWMSGNLSVAGTVTHNDVQNLESIGIVTAQTGIRVITGGIDVSAGIVTAPSTLVGSAVTTDSKGIRVAGVVTATSFVGDGGSLTGIDATAIKTGTTKVQTSTPGISNEVGGLGIGTFSGAGLNVTGVVTATEFHGDGSTLTGISIGSSTWYAPSTVAGLSTTKVIGVNTTTAVGTAGSEGAIQSHGNVNITDGALVISQIVNQDVTIPAGKNGLLIGPTTIGTGNTVDVAEDSVLVIV